MATSKRIGIIIMAIMLGPTLLFCTLQKKQVSKSDELQTRPNILIVNIDDLGFHDISAFGSEIYETPNIDKLYKESYSFRNAYANYPRCLPSRYAMITATYPVQEFNSDLSIITKENNFIKQFKNAGYHSFYVGKWHLGEEQQNTPKGFGFDESFASGGAGGVASYFHPYNTRQIIAPIGKVPPVPDVKEYSKEGDYLMDKLTDRMIAYLQKQNTTKPFFAMLCPYAVHTPFEAKQKDIKRNAKQIKNYDFGSGPEFISEGNGVTKMKQNDSVYAAMVENMDRNLGRLLNAIDNSPLKNNTILVFTSDHGGLSNKGSRKRRLATSNYPLRAGKGHLYEGGIRVPLMIRWPNHIKVKDDTESIVALMDLMPTLLDLSTESKLKKVDGKSFKNVLNQSENWSDRTLFFHERMARPRNTGDYPCTAMRSGKYKLLHYFEKNEYELYDLSEDPSEEKNIISNLPVIAAQMKSQLASWKSEQRITNN